MWMEHVLNTIKDFIHTLKWCKVLLLSLHYWLLDKKG